MIGKKGLLETLLVLCFLLIIPFTIMEHLRPYQDVFFFVLTGLFGATVIVAISLAIHAYLHRNVKPEFLELEAHLKKLNRKGMHDEDIAKKLKDAGWKEHTIQLVMHDVHKPGSSIEKLQGFVNDMLRKGKGREEIKEILLTTSWPEEIVDLTLV